MFEIVADEKSILANFVASEFDKKIIRPRVGIFADSETFVRIRQFGEVLNKTVFIIQQFDFPREGDSPIDSLNDQLFKFFLLCDFVKKLGAKKIIACLPYLPYSRQDKVFNGKMDGTIGLIGKFFQSAEVDKVLSFDLHEPAIKKTFAVPLEEMSVDGFWYDFLKELRMNFSPDDQTQWCLVAPDKGRCPFAIRIADMLGMGFAYVEKERIAKDDVVAIKLVGDVKDKIVVVIDDIIDTAKTACNASELLSENGSKKIFGCFTHSVMTPGAIQKIEQSGYEKVFVTDTTVLNDETISCEKITVLNVQNLLYQCIETVWKNLK